MQVSGMTNIVLLFTTYDSLFTSHQLAVRLVLPVMQY